MALPLKPSVSVFRNKAWANLKSELGAVIGPGKVGSLGTYKPS